MFELNQNLVAIFLPIAVIFVLLELIVAQLTQKSVHSLSDTLCNFGIMFIARMTQPLFTLYVFYSLGFLERLSPIHLPDSPATIAAAVLLTDFLYYWQHRFSHTNRHLWFFHEVHHSSKFFNLATSFRLHWFGRLLTPIFFAPVIFLGFSAQQVTLFFILNLFYQFFLHTQLIGKLPLVEGILNTPSAHRVHHSRNKEYFNKNYGGILLIWDRLFGTYEAENAVPVFGTIGKFESNNPFTVQFHKLGGYQKLTNSINRLMIKMGIKAQLASENVPASD